MSGKRGAGCRCDTRRIGGLENECSCFLSAAEDTRRIGGLEISHEAGGQFGYLNFPPIFYKHGRIDKNYL